MNAVLNTLHEHPLNKDERVFGRRLQPGERLEEGDVYADNGTSTWQLVPKPLVGMAIGENSEATFVRLKD